MINSPLLMQPLLDTVVIAKLCMIVFPLQTSSQLVYSPTSNKSTWKVHNHRSHYNYFRIVNVEKYSVSILCNIMRCI